MNRTIEYDEDLKSNIKHYANHKQMLPFIGKYWGKFKKLLIIGESHYLPPETKKKTIKNWYKLTSDQLTEDEYWWTATAELLDIAGENQIYKSKGHLIWKNIELAIIQSGFNPSDKTNLFQYVSYMNLFQRPAQNTGDSIIYNDDDVVFANNVLKEVCSIIKPEYLFFVSSKAYSVSENIDEVVIGHSCHPSCKWWNMKSKSYTFATQTKPLTGKESFIRFLKHYKIFE